MTTLSLITLLAVALFTLVMALAVKEDVVDALNRRATVARRMATPRT